MSNPRPKRQPVRDLPGEIPFGGSLGCLLGRSTPARVETAKRQAGRQPGEAVWRWELRLRGDALQLRKRGQGEVVVDFRRCATLADQAAIARAWAYAFGNAESTRPNGHYRLTVPAERYAEDGRGFPLTRTRPVDPLWRLVQEADGRAPIETLAQVRERKEAARAEWRPRPTRSPCAGSRPWSRSTIITSQFPTETWHDQLGDPLPPTRSVIVSSAMRTA